MITVFNEVKTYDEPETPAIKVRSHWNDNRKIILEVGGERVTVTAEDLKAAIDNATNTSRF